MRITPAQLKAQRAGKPLPRAEREVQAAILAYLRTVPGVVGWRNNVGAVKDGSRYVRFGFKGLSDIAGWARTCNLCLPETNDMALMQPCLERARWVPVPLYIEVKSPGKHPTREQAAFLRAVTDAGGIAIVATCVDDVRKVLQP